MGTFTNSRTRVCMGEPNPNRLDTKCQHDGHGWWESETDWGDECDRPGLWFKDTCLSCGRHAFHNTKGERVFPDEPIGEEQDG